MTGGAAAGVVGVFLGLALEHPLEQGRRVAHLAEGAVGVDVAER